MKSMRGSLGVLTLGAGLATGAAAAPPSASELTARVDAYFAPIVANHDFSGAVLVARGDRVLVDRAYGLADPELGVPSTTSNRYRVASLTKTFTAAAIVMLAEQGALRLDDKLARFLPEFPRAGEITLLHLLSHSGGLGDPDYRQGFRERIGLAELVQRIGARPRLFEPGAEARYSNAGFNVLARVVEVASGTTYDEFLRRRIFGPLGMTASGNIDDESIVPGRVRGFLPGPPPAGVVNAPWSDVGFSIGSGSLVSTTADLHRWARAVETERLYRRSALGYPYGWGRLGADRRAGLEQTGLGTGFTASLAIWFADSLSVVVLGNVESASWARWSADLAALARGESVAPFPLRREIDVRPAELERYAGRYATGEHTLVIEKRADSLWLLLDEWPMPKYLAPVADGEFELRSDFGRIVFEPSRDGAGPAPRLAWVFSPEERTVYPRQPPPAPGR